MARKAERIRAEDCERDLHVVLAHVIGDYYYAASAGGNRAIVEAARAGDNEALRRVIGWVMFVTEWRGDLLTLAEEEVFRAAMRLEVEFDQRACSSSSNRRAG